MAVKIISFKAAKLENRKGSQRQGRFRLYVGMIKSCETRVHVFWSCFLQTFLNISLCFTKVIIRVSTQYFYFHFSFIKFY